jgi:hypothetical protein
MFKRFLVLTTAAGVAAVCLAVSAGAGGPSTHAFLCYSKYQVNPGVWPLTSTKPHHSAADLMAAGYWSPYAETATPTATRITGGYYLICNLPSTLSPVPGVIVTQKGKERQTDTWTATHPGYYPKAK